ncbi:DUF2231 domain-containing protein [Actinophytocola sp. KF-1]
MRSRARALGHPIHQMLIVFPLGLLTTAVVFDVLGLITDRPGFAVTSAYMIAAGVVGGVVAGIFGLVDWLAVPPGTRARRVGLLHGAGNVVVLLLFAVSFLLRGAADDWAPNAWALVLGFAGFAVAGVTGWLGGELVDRLGVGVDEGANVDAPSSLSRRPVPRMTTGME